MGTILISMDKGNSPSGCSRQLTYLHSSSYILATEVWLHQQLSQIDPIWHIPRELLLLLLWFHSFHERLWILTSVLASNQTYSIIPESAEQLNSDNNIIRFYLLLP
jgi:hypothetical protein